MSDVAGASARRAVLVATGCGVLAAAVASVVLPAPYLPLIGWDVGALVFLAIIWRRIGHLDGPATAADASREDPTRAVADLVLLVAAVASLLAIGWMIVRANDRQPLDVVLHVGLGVASVIVSWVVVHTIFTLRYARLYYSDYSDGRGGVNFHDCDPEAQPRFVDFAYIAFTVGMTYQVSDTELRTTSFRGHVLRQALMSYLFGAVILALLINLVAGLNR
ncbi:Uncharacterized membrane protein [Actinopolymorpha cephalotaxi]|uniref:Membrane protein n=1 Tax=Actinopolymorpha cephalotaxi TaxID=504797 RepID=A0A1I3AQI1_9ACTN|nr:DUF1345 domain-containing protein [Actinopolymorpha cephalotaxi]NYH86012.1 putative membrane protein [Actinopolymorpha cephalotaxi]SFH52273.1 Uncharacterized membrane protein [Actinopolymorpha cephalotaxi]